MNLMDKDKVPLQIEQALGEIRRNLSEGQTLDDVMNNIRANATNPELIKLFKSFKVKPENFYSATDKIFEEMQDYSDDERLEELGIRRKVPTTSFFRLNGFVNAFANNMERYKVSNTQLKVLSYISYQSELTQSGDDITMSSIAKSTGMKFTTVQRCVMKLAEGYAYKYSNETEAFSKGAGLLRYSKDESQREGVIKLTTKGRRFLEDIAVLVGNYTEAFPKVKVFGTAKFSLSGGNLTTQAESAAVKLVTAMKAAGLLSGKRGK